MLVGFHGYAESPETQLERLSAIPGADRWLRVSIQALHRFYQRRTTDIVASWMTRQHRELAIADNITFVGRVVDAVAREWPCARRPLSCMPASRRASRWRFARQSRRIEADRRSLIAVGGDVPPELDAASLARVRTALVCRGARDLLYAKDTHENDLRRLNACGPSTSGFPIEFDGGHEWASAWCPRRGLVFSAGAAIVDSHSHRHRGRRE